MLICRTIAELRAARRVLASPVGFVPTMGALHAGHLSLVERSAAQCASTIASIYVNPLQFGEGEDYSRYPRPFAEDAAYLERHRVDVLFAPDDAMMYPPGAQVTVDPGEISRHLEGERRPGHFRGVATIVLKLLNAVTPDRAYFGSKDAQQLAIVKRMIGDLDLRIEVVACPTVREPDGLALSSRNRYLTAEQRSDAVLLSKALRAIVDASQGGGQELKSILAESALALAPLRMDYLAIVDPNAFVPLDTLPPRSALLAVGAAFCGSTRLIDNMELRTP